MTMSSELPHTAATQPSGRVPDFFIVGHHKSGTTAMYEMLRDHPQIYMPKMKEPEFFGRDLTRRQELRAGIGAQKQTFAQTRPHTYAEYLSLFADAEPGQRAGEASPSYLGSLTAATQISEIQPAARIIAILREPASFLRSLHLQMVRNHVQSEWDLGRAIAGEDLAEQSRRVQRYTDRVRYVEQLQRYHDVFGADQVLVLIYDDFRADNEATVRAVLRLLDVDADVPIKAVDANPTVAARSRVLDQWAHALRTGRGPFARAAKATVKALTPPRLRRTAVRTIVYGDAPSPDEELMLDLRRRFKPEVVALSEYLKRDLVKLWGYDSIG
jgi:Sulfotransferase family